MHYRSLRLQKHNESQPLKIMAALYTAAIKAISCLFYIIFCSQIIPTKCFSGSKGVIEREDSSTNEVNKIYPESMSFYSSGITSYHYFYDNLSIIRPPPPSVIFKAEPPDTFTNIFEKPPP